MLALRLSSNIIDRRHEAQATPRAKSSMMRVQKPALCSSCTVSCKERGQESQEPVQELLLREWQDLKREAKHS